MSSINSNQREISDKLSSQLFTFIRAVFTEQLNCSDDTYRIGYGSDWRDESELHPSVTEKFGIRIYFVDKQRGDYPLTVLCALTDKLGDIFRKHHVSPFLSITFKNNDNDYIDFKEKSDFDLISSCQPFSSTIKSEEEYADFVEAVSKELLFTSIKYS